jgi:hypothetical protein
MSMWVGYPSRRSPSPFLRAEGQSVLRFIIGVLWLVLIVFIILVFLNMPGIR